MAKLTCRSLTLEIKYKGVEFAEVIYEIGFYWQGESLINDAVLKRSGDYWASRNPGTFLVSSEAGECFERLISNALETDGPDYWEGLEPDLILAIYPSLYFPFIVPPVRRKNDPSFGVWYEGKKRGETKSPQDSYTLIILIDTINFKNGSGYAGEGISLHLIAERAELEQFQLDLSAEFAAFKENYEFSNQICGWKKK